MGERQGSALDPLKPFLKEGFKNPKNFKKIIYQCVFKVFEIPKNFFQKVLWWGAGVKPLPYKPQFESAHPVPNKKARQLAENLLFPLQMRPKYGIISP